MATIDDILEFLRSQRQPLPTRPRETPLNPAPEYSEDAAAGAARLAEGFVPDNSDIPMPPPAPPPLPNRPLTTAAPQAPQAATEDAPAPSPSPTLTPGVAATAQPRSPFELAPGDQNALDRLAAFGAALASTRSPTFQGAFGEGIQALLNTRRQQQQDTRQQQQVDVEQEYRRAVVANQAAELAFARDPDNPINQLRRADTAAKLASIELIRRQAANVGQGGSAAARRGQGVYGTQDGRGGLYYPQTGEFVPDPEGFNRARSQTEIDTAERRVLDRRLRIVNEAEDRINRNPRTQNLQGVERDRLRADIARNIERELGIGGGSGTAAPTEPQTPQNRVRVSGPL